MGDPGSIPGSEEYPGEGHGNPLQYSCLENPMDRGAWWATVHGVTESDMTEQLTHTILILITNITMFCYIYGLRQVYLHICTCVCIYIVSK